MVDPIFIVFGSLRYKEVNPAVFSCITFPFLFGIMFGDVGHGVILTLVAAYFIIREKLLMKSGLNEIVAMIFAGVCMSGAKLGPCRDKTCVELPLGTAAISKYSKSEDRSGMAASARFVKTPSHLFRVGAWILGQGLPMGEVDRRSAPYLGWTVVEASSHMMIGDHSAW